MTSQTFSGRFIPEGQSLEDIVKNAPQCNIPLRKIIETAGSRPILLNGSAAASKIELYAQKDRLRNVYIELDMSGALEAPIYPFDFLMDFASSLITDFEVYAQKGGLYFRDPGDEPDSTTTISISTNKGRAQTISMSASTLLSDHSLRKVFTDKPRKTYTQYSKKGYFDRSEILAIMRGVERTGYDKYSVAVSSEAESAFFSYFGGNYKLALKGIADSKDFANIERFLADSLRIRTGEISFENPTLS